MRNAVNFGLAINAEIGMTTDCSRKITSTLTCPRATKSPMDCDCRKAFSTSPGRRQHQGGWVTRGIWRGCRQESCHEDFRHELVRLNPVRGKRVRDCLEARLVGQEAWPTPKVLVLVRYLSICDATWPKARALHLQLSFRKGPGRVWHPCDSERQLVPLFRESINYEVQPSDRMSKRCKVSRKPALYYSNKGRDALNAQRKRLRTPLLT